MVPAYREVTVYLPIYNNGSITSYSTATYFEAAGEEMISPTIEMIPYLECTIHPFDNSVINQAYLGAVPQEWVGAKRVDYPLVKR